MAENENEVRDPAGLLAAYEKAKEDLVNLRNEHKALQDKMETMTEDQFRLKALAAETKLALQSKGLKDTDRLMPYIGTDGLDFDEEGHVTGLDERLEKLKADLPEVFDPKVRAGGRADIFADGAPEQRVDPFRAAIHQAISG